MPPTNWGSALLLWCTVVVPTVGGVGAQARRVEAPTIDATAMRAVPTVRVAAQRLSALSDDSVDFGRIAAGCFLDGGEAVALSTTPRALLVLGPGASRFRSVGRGGTGPGEFNQPWALSCFSGDSVAVLELFRVTTGAAKGGAMSSQMIEPLQGQKLLEPVGRFTSGRMLFRARTVAPNQRMGTQRDTVELLLSKGAVDRKAMGERIAYLPADEYVRVRRGEVSTMSVHPFGRSLLVATNATTAYILDTGSDLLAALSTTQAPSRSVRFDMRRRPLERATVEAHWRRRQAAAGLKATREVESLIAENTELPTYLPRFDRMVALREGGVLLRQFRLDEDATTQWLLLDASLRPRGVMTLDASTRVLAASGNRLLLLESSEQESRLTIVAVAGR